MAAPQVIIAKAALSLATADDSKVLRRILTFIAAVFIALLLLLSAILDILSAPSDLDGALGELKEQFGFLVESAPGVGNGDLLIDGDIEAATSWIADAERRAIIQTGLSLVGKVPYFWGGKSKNGWNDEWGKLKTVTASGSSSSGKPKPYGLDCSGFVDWTLRTSGFWNATSPTRFGSTASLWPVTKQISESELLPGDLGFLQKPGSSGINHVGFFYGYNEKGEKMWLHCASGGGGVVLNTYKGFKHYKRLTEVQP